MTPTLVKPSEGNEQEIWSSNGANTLPWQS